MLEVLNYMIKSGELIHVIYAILGVVVVAILRGFMVKVGGVVIDTRKHKDDKNPSS